MNPVPSPRARFKALLMNFAMLGRSIDTRLKMDTQ